MIAAVPLAWKNLVHSRKRFVMSILGIAFAVGLMATQLGFYLALTDSMTQVLRLLEADLVVYASDRSTLNSAKTFDRAALTQLKADSAVTAAHPVYIETQVWRLQVLKENRSPAELGPKPYPIRVIAFELDDLPIRIKESDELREGLARPGTAWIDRESKEGSFPLPFDKPGQLANQALELASRRLKITGTFELGTDFVNDGNLLMSAENFAQYFGYRAPLGNPLDRVDLGLVHIADGASPAEVKQRLTRILGPNSGLTVATYDEFVAKERDYWRQKTPIGFIFQLGLVIGFGVGTVICYQIIYSGLADLQSEFATLKAIGYSNRYLVRQVLEQSVYLSVIGFICGMGVSWLLFRGLNMLTGLPMEFTPLRAAGLYVATLVMCLVSGCLAVRKVLDLDPADLF